jgi:hypothetical protein
MMFDLQKWQGHDWKSLEDYEAMQTELIEDLKSQLADAGVELVQVLPNDWHFAAVAQSTEHDRYVYITIDDVRKNSFWAENVKLRRMSSLRDWKGEQNHLCDWGQVGKKAAELLTAEYDDEIL